MDGTEQTIAQWLTYFNLLTVIIDPYTHESGWIIPTADRIFAHYEEADIRCAFVVTGDGDGAARGVVEAQAYAIDQICHCV